MVELFLLPALTGVFLGRVAFIVKHCSKVELEIDTSFNPWEFKRPNESLEALYSEVKQDAKSVRVKQAVKVMQEASDASCDSIADALGVDRLSVRRKSPGSRRKKKVTDYHPSDIQEMAVQ